VRYVVEYEMSVVGRLSSGAIVRGDATSVTAVIATATVTAATQAARDAHPLPIVNSSNAAGTASTSEAQPGAEMVKTSAASMTSTPAPSNARSRPRRDSASAAVIGVIDAKKPARKCGSANEPRIRSPPKRPAPCDAPDVTPLESRILLTSCSGSP